MDPMEMKPKRQPPTRPRKPRKKSPPLSTQDKIAALVGEALGGLSGESEKTFEWLINPETGARLRIDVYFEGHKLAVEYQSELHFGKKPRKFKSMDLRDVLFRDFVKRTLLAERGITLLEITFYEPHTLDHIRERLRRLRVIE